LIVLDLSGSNDLDVVPGHDITLVSENAAELENDILFCGDGALVGERTVNGDLDRAIIAFKSGIGGERGGSRL
jgi:hypothetical protein